MTSSQEIWNALATADLGLMLISKSFVVKPWPMRELLRILAQPHQALPVLYLMDYDELKIRLRAQTQASCANGSCLIIMYLSSLHRSYNSLRASYPQ